MLVGVWTVDEGPAHVMPAVADPLTGAEHPVARMPASARTPIESQRGEERRATADSVPFV